MRSEHTPSRQVANQRFRSGAGAIAAHPARLQAVSNGEAAKILRGARGVPRTLVKTAQNKSDVLTD